MHLLSRSKSFHRLSKGFTLIELMIAIAIVGVLAAIAVPAYSNYLARARVAEAVNYAQSCKTGYVEFYSTRGTLPTGATALVDANCPTVATENIASVVVGGAIPAIRINLNNAATSPLPQAIRGHVVVLQPLTTAGARMADGQIISAWRCALTTAAGGVPNSLAMDLVPTICRNTTLI